MSESSPKRFLKKKPVRFVLFLLYCIVALFVLLEFIMRISDPMGISYYFEGRRYFKAMTWDPDFGYLHTPGYRAKLQEVDVIINSEGLRMPEFDPQKRKGEKRLLIIGDSLVFGWGAPQDSILSAFLQYRLQEEYPEWTVISAGACSWNTRTEYEFFRKRGLSYEPDILLMVVVANDVEPKEVGRTFVDRARLNRELDNEKKGGFIWTTISRISRAVSKPSYALTTVRHVIKKRSQAAYFIDMFKPGSAAWEDAENAMGGIIELCRRSEVDLVVFFYCNMAAEFNRVCFEKYSKYLESHKVPYYLLPDEVYDKRFRNSIVDIHPNASGHRLIAEVIFEVISSMM